ncbi:MAG: 16S rRNA (cytosine(1402)-N(4))-methyltransferase RsmH [Lactobacillaceae bacterium]|jgi:16S rRNA (cytosine1402-N4)-methyltransferase|nr:16S rRNA (cytosine(1402)-N(4))-methyltransferase RsmH [Lactobacillaceae bacterium]
MENYGHTTVLLKEAIDQLKVQPDGIYVDATLGGGGHTDLLVKKILNGKGKVFSFDQDINAIEFNSNRFVDAIANKKLVLIHSNFANLTEKLEEQGIYKIDGIVFDLGVSSPQFDNADRGFSYRLNSKLDMRMDQNQKLSAYEVINEYSETELANIIYQYGDEKFSRQIAKNIVNDRPINTTFELVEEIKKSLPNKVLNSKGHPAKKTFQAIRIEVNSELDVLKTALKKASDLLNDKGRISVITFQSLEDRIVKKFFVDLSAKNNYPIGLPIEDKYIISDFTNITKKPIVPSKQEIFGNPRSKSSKLRVIERN